jgi:cell division protease FtsH
MDRIRVVLGGRAAEEVAIGVPTTYGVSDVRDATRLALRLVANYGLDPVVGITTYAPPPGRLGFMQKSFEVTVDNIDSDLFGDVIPGGGFQPSDQSWHEMRSRAAEIVKEAYKENLEELERRKNAVNAVADALIEKETVTGEELEVLIESNPPRAVSSSSTESPAAAAAAGKGV